MAIHEPSDAKVRLPTDLVAAAPGEADGGKRKKKKKEKGKEQQYGRAAETLFRSAYHTHMGLTALADGKASIMITINGLLLTVVTTSAAPWVTRQQALIGPSVVILVTCLGSLIFAIMAVRPRVIPAGTLANKTSEQLDEVNLLFFGNYTQLPERVFRREITEMIVDPERMYSVMSRDLYGMGTVLSRKFKMLRHSYDLFTGGLILGVLSFIAVYAGMVF
jgi:hypothetical protein